MTKVKCGYRGIDVMLAILLCVVVSFPAFAQTSQQTSQAPRSDASGEPLANALRRFAKESGYDVVFPEHLVRGKHASPIHDSHNSYDKLTQMLAGSGLVPRFTRRDAFVLEPIAPDVAPDLSLERIEVLTSPFGGSDGEYRWFGDKLLEASLRVLRGSSELGFKTYDFTLFVWLSSEGKIVDLEGYGSTEHQETLTIAEGMLRGLLVGAMPPKNMPQPVGIRIVSQ